SSRRVRPGEVLALKGGGSVQVIGRGEGGDARVHFQTPAGLDKKTVPPEETLLAYLERHGEIPLPPYIHRADPDDRRRLDRERYQTVFARSPGAVAAPTAGLHFTPRLLEELKGRGVQTASLTLHVGAGTFRPVTVSRAEDHLLPPERFVLPEATAVAITETRRRNGRVFACGTTVARVLEARGSGGMVVPGEGKCGLFILPGHRFRIIDGLLTNFHLPRSTLLMLVSALAGRRRVLKAYEEAVSRDYRFYSYGDAMLVFRHGQAT
ncbi:MAG: S-adenosylmethionine:tRNA ribosyltransferase-isomerase, partial [Acidobacteriota bacterium]